VHTQICALLLDGKEGANVRETGSGGEGFSAKNIAKSELTKIRKSDKKLAIAFTLQPPYPRERIYAAPMAPK
jgi:hypothetical protein